jgi:glycosyltransferase involved in cell wall biosynthesis
VHGKKLPWVRESPSPRIFYGDIKLVEISIIIPTLNEGTNLIRCLESISKQNFRDYEIIISDSNSKDNTKKIAKDYGATVIEGPKKGPGFARNLGAKYSNGNILLFIDADTILNERDTLQCIYNIMKHKDIVGGTSTFSTFDGNRLEKFIFDASSKFMKLLNTMKIKVAPGYFIFVKKDIFEKVGGFDIELPYCEDHDLMKRISKFGKTVIINKRILSSSRRLTKRGLVGTFIDYIPPTITYIVSKDLMKKKFKFNPSSSFSNR